MNSSQEKLQIAMKHAMAHRPKIGGFAYLAECLRLAGVEHNLWSLPGLQSIYVMKDGVVVQQGTPLISGMSNVPDFNEEAVIIAIRNDQAGQSTFAEFLSTSWDAGVIGYDVDFSARIVSYYGSRGECYKESYPSVDVGEIEF